MSSLIFYLTKEARDWRPIVLKRGRSSSAPQVQAFSIIFGDEGQSFFLKHLSIANYYFRQLLVAEIARGNAFPSGSCAYQ